MKSVNVRFLNGVSNKKYRFFTDIENLIEGDLLVVDANGSFHTATFVEYIDNSETTDKWVIQKIDLTQHHERLNRKKRKEELKVVLDKELKKYQEIAMYELIAKENSELKEHLNEYKELIK